MICEGCAKKKIPREKVDYSNFFLFFCNLLILISVALTHIYQVNFLRSLDHHSFNFFYFFICYFLQYVDHIKYCSKFKAPCRFHVVGCNTSVSRDFHLNLLLVS